MLFADSGWREVLPYTYSLFFCPERICIGYIVMGKSKIYDKNSDIFLVTRVLCATSIYVLFNFDFISTFRFRAFNPNASRGGSRK